MKITIPKSPKEVTQEHNDFIATEILGWKKKHEMYFNSKDEVMFIYDYEFQPFTNIEHAKLLDPWLFENDLEISMKGFNYSKGTDLEKFYTYYVEEWRRNRMSYRELGQGMSELESFARTVAILKAYLEIKK